MKKEDRLPASADDIQSLFDRTFRIDLGLRNAFSHRSASFWILGTNIVPDCNGAVNPIRYYRYDTSVRRTRLDTRVLGYGPCFSRADTRRTSGTDAAADLRQ